MGTITKALDDGQLFDAIMIDYKSAFHKVPFTKMLAQVKAHGIGGQILNWLENWTKDRRQRVVLNGIESMWVEVLSSVVQGSVIGPILFLIYINGLDKQVAQHDKDILISKYADDTKLGRIIKDLKDHASLQQALDNLVLWCTEWGMEIHPDKCNVIHFGAKNPRRTYKIGPSIVQETREARDLGVIIQENCSVTEHVQKIARRAHVVLGQLKRATVLRDSSTFVKLYTSYVRPLLESAAPVWNSCN